MAEAGRSGLLRLPCRTGQWAGDGRFSISRLQSLVERACTSQPTRQHDMGSDATALQPVAAATAYLTSLAERTLRRHTPKVGAQCLNRARWDLCGGQAAMPVPTAKTDRRHIENMRRCQNRGVHHTCGRSWEKDLQIDPAAAGVEAARSQLRLPCGTRES
jgi:hypothetical protein